MIQTTYLLRLVKTNMDQLQVACAMQVLGPANCSMTDSCFCTDLVIEKSIKLCLAQSCSVDNQFAAQRFRARTCEWPVRNKAALVHGLSWGLFVVATVFVAMRMLSRMQAFKGAGYELATVLRKESGCGMLTDLV